MSAGSKSCRHCSDERGPARSTEMTTKPSIGWFLIDRQESEAYPPYGISRGRACGSGRWKVANELSLGPGKWCSGRLVPKHSDRYVPGVNPRDFLLFCGKTRETSSTRKGGLHCGGVDRSA